VLRHYIEKLISWLYGIRGNSIQPDELRLARLQALRITDHPV
jgi:hypothetical protein